jgi:hypothetical protein
MARSKAVDWSAFSFLFGSNPASVIPEHRQIDQPGTGVVPEIVIKMPKYPN